MGGNGAHRRHRIGCSQVPLVQVSTLIGGNGPTAVWTDRYTMCIHRAVELTKQYTIPVRQVGQIVKANGAVGAATHQPTAVAAHGNGLHRPCVPG